MSFFEVGVVLVVLCEKSYCRVPMSVHNGGKEITPLDYNPYGTDLTLCAKCKT